MEKFRILMYATRLHSYFVDFIAVNVPKKDAIYRNKVEEKLISLMENISRANINAGNIRNKYQKEALVDISIIDSLLTILREKNIIDKTKFISYVNRLLELKKMIYGWIKSDETEK